MQGQDKVCIIDDDQNIIEIYSTKLRSEGFDVVFAEDGKTGLEMIKKEKPNIILLDIIMPKKNGLEVLHELQNNPKISKIPVIILSNVSDSEIVEKIGEFSTNFYIVKSLTTPKKVAGMIKEVLYGQK